MQSEDYTSHRPLVGPGELKKKKSSTSKKFYNNLITEVTMYTYTNIYIYTKKLDINITDQ